MRLTRHRYPSFMALAAIALGAGCPKPSPDPVPADCKKPGQACADPPAPPEGPPPIGTQVPPRG